MSSAVDIYSGRPLVAKKRSDKKRKGSELKMYSRPSQFRNQNTHMFKVNVDDFWFLGGSRRITQLGAAQGYRAYFRMDDNPDLRLGAGACFDLFRIRKVIFTLRPQKTRVTSASDAIGGYGSVYATAPHNVHGGTFPTTIDGFFEFDNVKVSNVFDITPHSRVIVPQVQAGVYDSAPTLQRAANLPNSTWLRVQSYTVPYFGCNLFFEGHGGTSVAQTFDLDAVYYVEFKNVN